MKRLAIHLAIALLIGLVCLICAVFGVLGFWFTGSALVAFGGYTLLIGAPVSALFMR